MRSRALLNWILLGAVAILAAAAYFLPRQGNTPPPPLIAGISPDAIDHIHIQRAGQPDIELVRKGGHWRLTAPLQAAANGFRADALASVVAADSERSFNAAGADLGKFGLDPPRARLRLNEAHINVGGTEPITGRRYVQVGDTIHLIPDDFFHDVSAAAPEFVSLSPLPAGAEPVRFTLPGFVLQRNGGGHWSPVTGTPHGDAGAADDFVARWRQAQALEVTRYTPSGPRDTVTVDLGQGRSALVFDIIAEQPTLVLGRRDLGVAYHFTASQGTTLLKLSPTGEKSGDKKTAGR
jgi:hypothetical protein